jgi:hypothetical protein
MKSTKKYRAIFQITLINSLAHSGELIGCGLLIIPFIWIFYPLWKVTFGAAGMDIINGMTLHTTMWYLMMAELLPGAVAFLFLAVRVFHLGLKRYESGSAIRWKHGIHFLV